MWAVRCKLVTLRVVWVNSSAREDGGEAEGEEGRMRKVPMVEGEGHHQVSAPTYH